MTPSMDNRLQATGPKVSPYLGKRSDTLKQLTAMEAPIRRLCSSIPQSLQNSAVFEINHPVVFPTNSMVRLYTHVYLDTVRSSNVTHTGAFHHMT